MSKLLGLIISLLVITSTGRYLRPIKNKYALPYYYSVRRPNRQFDPLADIVQVTTTATLSTSKCVPPTNTCSHDYECPPYHKCFADRFCGYKVCRKIATTNSAAETTTKSLKANEITTELPCTNSWNRCDESKKRCEFDSQCPPCYTCHDDVDYGYKVCKHVSNITTTSKPTSIFEPSTVTSTPEVMTTEAASVTSTPAITSDVTISDVTTESIILSSALLNTFDATVSEVTTTESTSTNILNLTTSITTTSVVTSTTASEVTPLVTTRSTISETTVPVSTIKIPELTESTVLVEDVSVKSDNDVRLFGPSTRRSDDDFIFQEETVSTASLEFEPSEETAIYGFKAFENMMSQISETTVLVISEKNTLGPRTTISQPYDEQFSGSGIGSGSGDEQIDHEESILSTRTPLEDDFSFDEVTQESDSDSVVQIIIANKTNRENIKRADSEKVTNITIIGPANNNIIDSDITKSTGTTATTAEDIITTISTEKTFTEVKNNVTIAAHKATALEYIKSVPFVKAAEVVTNEAAKVGTTTYPTTEELLYETSVITEQERFRERSGDVKENKESFQVNVVTESPTNEKMKIDNLSISDKVDEISSKTSSLIDVIGILPDVNPDNYLSNKDYYVILDDYE